MIRTQARVIGLLFFWILFSSFIAMKSMNFNRFWPFILCFALSGFIFSLDQISKMWAFNQFVEKPFFVFPWFSFTYSENSGIAFGLPIGGSFLLVVTTFLIVAFCWYAFTHLDLKCFSVKISASLILGGALGNTLDRFRYGFVRDFIDIGAWPTFNVADTSLTIGLLLLLVILYRSPDHGILPHPRK